MFFAHVKGLGFIKLLSVDGGRTQQIFFTHDFEQATSWATEQKLCSSLNGDINSGDFDVVRIEVI